MIGGRIMKKKLTAFALAVNTFVSISAIASASTTHTVVEGDSMWKIAVKYQVGLSEIINANPNIINPELTPIKNYAFSNTPKLCKILRIS